MAITHKILVVDDDLDTLKLVGTTLEKQGFVIVAAKDGQEALEKVAQHKPDLILLDIMMPKMDGYEVTRRLRAEPQTAGIPIILFTAKAQVDDKVAGLEAGADDYLTKPTHPAELVARVRSILKRPVTSMLPPLPGEPAPGSASVVVGVIAAKGGQGGSTLAINLAAGFKERFKDATVVLAELTPGHGDLNIRLGKPNQQGLVDLLKRSPNDIHRMSVEQALSEHKSGMRLLLAGSKPSDVTLTAAGEQMASVVRELSHIAAYVVLDLGVNLPVSTQRALEQCTHVVVLAEPDPSSIEQTKALLADLVSLGITENKIIMAMVHRVRTDLAMNAAELQKALGHELNAVFTPAPELAHNATRMQQSMLKVDGQSYTAQQTLKLVNLIAEPKPR